MCVVVWCSERGGAVGGRQSSAWRIHQSRGSAVGLTRPPAAQQAEAGQLSMSNSASITFGRNAKGGPRRGGESRQTRKGTNNPSRSQADTRPDHSAPAHGPITPPHLSMQGPLQSVGDTSSRTNENLAIHHCACPVPRYTPTSPCAFGHSLGFLPRSGAERDLAAPKYGAERPRFRRWRTCVVFEPLMSTQHLGMTHR